MKENERQFVADLTELSRKHGVGVASCGCCDSPFLVTIDEDEKSGSYYVNSVGGELEWVAPKEKAAPA